MTYYIETNPAQTTDKTIFTATNGEGFVKDNQLHLTDGKVHYIYKFADQMWFMRNKKTGVDYELGVGASPTINVDNIQIIDQQYWEQLNYVMQESEMLDLQN